MQCEEMQHDQCQQHDRQCNHVQGKEAIQGDTGNQIIAAYPGDQTLPDNRYGPKQRYDHLRAPVGHLAPGQHVTYERLCHQHDKNQHAEYPDQLSRFLVGAVDERTEHVQVDHDKEKRSARGVHIAKDPAVLDITHDVFDRRKGALGTGRVAHREPDTGQQLIDQHQQ